MRLRGRIAVGFGLVLLGGLALLLVPGGVARPLAFQPEGKRIAAETITLKNDSETVSKTVLLSGRPYEITVEGTVGDWLPTEYPRATLGEGVDALYCYATWRCPKPQHWHQLLVNGDGLDEFAGRPNEIPYNKSHK